MLKELVFMCLFVLMFLFVVMFLFVLMFCCCDVFVLHEC